MSTQVPVPTSIPVTNCSRWLIQVPFGSLPTSRKPSYSLSSLAEQVKITLMGYHDEPFEGKVDSVAWGIFVQDGSGGTSTGLLAAVNQTVDWVRLPQRFPVRIKITGKPPVPLRIGQTITVAVVPDSSDKIAHHPKLSLLSTK